MSSRKPKDAGTPNPAGENPATDLPGDTGSGEASGEGQDAPAIPPIGPLIAALLANDDFVALLVGNLPTPRELIPSLLSSEEFVKGLNSHIDMRIDVDLPELILASEDFAPGLKSLVDSHLDTVLPGLVAEAMPKPEAIETIPVESAVAAETAIDRTAREQAASGELMAKAARKKAEQRAKSKEMARGNFVALIETVPEVIEPIDLLAVSNAGLLIDDGTAFSIDFTHPLPLGALSLDDNGSVRLRHEAISIGDGIDESFPVKGVVLILKGDVGIRAARCEMPSTLMVGGGQRAQLGADSLIFRIPR